MPDRSGRLILLGPQQDYRSLRAALARLESVETAAVITAGWEEDEDQDAELVAAVGGRALNLRLFQRSEQLFNDDPELIQLLKNRQDELRLLRDVYRRRLAHGLTAARETLARRNGSVPIAPERESAIELVRMLDRQYFVRTSQVCDCYDARIDFSAREHVVRHREELREQLAAADVLLIAGGNAGIILNRLRLFDIPDLRPGLPLIAWSAGAMALGDQIVLFHDSPPQGPADPEVLRAGTGLYSELLPLPDARSRLKLQDRVRVELFARRFQPQQCIVFDDRTLLDRRDGRWSAVGPAQVLSGDGRLEAFGP